MEEPSQSAQISVSFPQGKEPVPLPVGWTHLNTSSPLTLLGPESDVRLAFVVTSASANSNVNSPAAVNMEEAAKEAWLQTNPAFNLSVRRQADAPSTEGWTRVCQIVYNTPAAESRLAIAILRILDESVFILLIDGSTAGVSRRMAQVTEILQAWKPAGLQSANLAVHPPAIWASSHTEQLNAFVLDALQRLLIPGVAIAIVQHGDVVYSEGFGVRKLGSPQPVTPATRFMIGSSTKPLTTLLMATLIDKGHFTWTTPVRELLPDFQLGNTEITGKLLIRHTVCACTGMPRRDLDFVFRFEGISPEQRLIEMRTMLPTTGFGETFQYSNLLVAAGGYAAARSFQPFGDLTSAYQSAMRQLVFQPIGMHSSCITRDEAAESDNVAWPHSTDLEEHCVPIDPKLDCCVDSVAPAGAAWSTVEDMARYISLELRGGLTPAGQQLVSQETLQSRWQGGIKITDNAEYGLGLMNSKEQGLRVVGHGGNTLGFTSDMYFLPQQDLGVVVLTNLRFANAFLAALRQRLFEILFEAAPQSEDKLVSACNSRHQSAASIRSSLKTDESASAWLNRIAGTYQNSELGTARIQRDGDHFIADFESWSSLLAVEVQPTGERLIVLTSPPWNGALRFLQNASRTGELILDAGQDKYTFLHSQTAPAR